MNVKLLRQIQKQITKEPRQFFMKWFFRRSKSIPNCHTAACIAGWALTLTKTKTKRPSDMFKKYGDTRAPGIYYDPAMCALRINDRQAGDLFSEGHWPREFQGSRRTLAKRAIARIEHMIKTGE